MTTIRRLTSRTLVVGASLLGGCNGGDGVGPGIPIVISATWTDEADDTHTLTFRSPDDGRIAGVVTGTEEHDDCFDGCPIGGFWRNGRLEITIERDSNQPKFVSEFNAANPTRLSFHQVGGNETFTLVQ